MTKLGTKMVVAIVALGVAFGCMDSDPQDPAQLVQQQTISACGGFQAALPPETGGADDYCAAELLDWTYDAATETLELTDARALLNCCGVRTVEMAQVDGVYVVTETDAPEDMGRLPLHVRVRSAPHGRGAPERRHPAASRAARDGRVVRDRDALGRRNQPRRRVRFRRDQSNSRRDGVRRGRSARRRGCRVTLRMPYRSPKATNMLRRILTLLVVLVLLPLGCLGTPQPDPPNINPAHIFGFGTLGPPTVQIRGEAGAVVPADVLLRIYSLDRTEPPVERDPRAGRLVRRRSPRQPERGVPAPGAARRRALPAARRRRGRDGNRASSNPRRGPWPTACGRRPRSRPRCRRGAARRSACATTASTRWWCRASRSVCRSPPSPWSPRPPRRTCPPAPSCRSSWSTFPSRAIRTKRSCCSKRRRPSSIAAPSPSSDTLVPRPGVYNPSRP